MFRFTVLADRVLDRAAMTAASAPLSLALISSAPLSSSGLLARDGARR